VKPAALKDSSSVRSTAQMTAENAAVLPFQMGLPALDAFPSKLWSRLAIRRARTLSIQAMSAPDPTGYAPLRFAITSYLAVSRGILCWPSRSSSLPVSKGALGLITRTFLQPGDAVWFEDPGYFMAREA